MENKNQFLQFLQEQRDKIRSVQFEMNKDITEKGMLNITQKREFFQHITLLSLGLSGVTFFTNKNVNKIYFTLGFCLLIGVVLLILFWLREILDKESSELLKLQDKYNIATEEKDSLIEEFAQKGYHEDILKEYYIALQKLPSKLIIEADIEKTKKLRKTRDKQQLDYFGEFVIFLFCMGILFLFISVLNYKFEWYMLFFIILLVFSLCCQDFVTKKSGMGFISYLISRFHIKIW